MCPSNRDVPFVAVIADSKDVPLSPFGGTMQDAVGSLSRVQAAIARGDLGPSLLEVARIIQGARRSGASIGEALGQADAFARPDPAAERQVRLAYGDDASGVRMSRERFAEVLNSYADGSWKRLGRPVCSGAT